MVAYLIKSDASEWFNQIIDFLNGSYIEYALTVNPTIYVSCIKQFCNTVAINQSNDVTRLQALVNKKKVVVTEAAIRDTLHLDDAKGVDCFPNEEIFTELARIGRKFNFSKYIFESLVRNVDSSSKFYMYPRFIHLIIQNHLGDLSTHTTKYISPTLTQKEVLDACAALARRVEHLEHDKMAQDLEIIKLNTRVKNLERTNKVKTLKLRRLRKVGTIQRVDTSDDTLIEDVSNQGRIIDELDKDEGIVLMNEKEETEEVRDNNGDAQVKGRQADIYQIDMDHAAKVLSMQEDESEVHEAVEVVTTTKLITEVVAAVSETVSAAAVVPIDPEEESSAKTPTETKSKDKGKDIDWEVAIDHVKQKAKDDPFIQRYQVMKKRLQTEAQARRNMMMYLKNTTGFRLDYFKGIEIESINETLAQKAANRRRRNEEVKDVEEIKQHLEIVPDEDDDAYTEATPFARKAPFVDYEIIHFNNKP
uniref:Xylulose kinase-1 n=1 Tax=Tanacetum cinerariifolium TaxID=118510 RepID=A0A699J586_TANCI|nr:hypothetical protein [Tanacetum cinerariifolium]